MFEAKHASFQIPTLGVVGDGGADAVACGGEVASWEWGMATSRDNTRKIIASDIFLDIRTKRSPLTEEPRNRIAS
jgi:hypothetical protein